MVFQSASQGGGFPELFRTVVLELNIIAELKHPNIVGFDGEFRSVIFVQRPHISV